MSEKSKKLGARGEEIAADFLKKNKYKILCRNYRCAFGEIDIIAQHKKTLSFVEVKTRSTSLYGTPQESVRKKKQDTMCRVAMEFIQRYNLEDRDARFDVVAIRLSPDGYRVDLIKNAFDLSIT